MNKNKKSIMESYCAIDSVDSQLAALRKQESKLFNETRKYLINLLKKHGKASEDDLLEKEFELSKWAFVGKDNANGKYISKVALVKRIGYEKQSVVFCDADNNDWYSIEEVGADLNVILAMVKHELKIILEQ